MRENEMAEMSLEINGNPEDIKGQMAEVTVVLDKGDRKAS
jgi:hypothetical protein